jgi:hypothetical protein
MALTVKTALPPSVAVVLFGATWIVGAELEEGSHQRADARRVTSNPIKKRPAQRGEIAS